MDRIYVLIEPGTLRVGQRPRALVASAHVNVHLGRSGDGFDGAGSYLRGQACAVSWRSSFIAVSIGGKAVAARLGNVYWFVGERFVED